MKKALFVVTLLLLWASLAFGQKNGTNTFSATDDFGTDSINLTNLVPSFNIPVILKGAGPINGSLSLELNDVCFVSGTVWTCNGLGSTANQGVVFLPIVQEMIGMLPSYTSHTSGGCTSYTITGVSGSDNLSFYPVASTTIWGPPVACGAQTATGIKTTDGSGYTFGFDVGGGVVNITTNSSASGWTINSIGTTITDAFSNTLTDSLPSGNLTDALGAVTSYTSSPAEYIYTDTTGTSQNVTLTSGTSHTFVPLGGSNCGASGSNNNFTPVTAINYPDGTSYSFGWQTNGTGLSGLINSITLRTGGQISYTYTWNSNCNAGTWGFSSLTRTTPDGAWSYTASTTSGITTTTVLDPGKNKTVHTFGGSGVILPTFRESTARYQNTGTVASPSYTEISSTSYCYNNHISDCSTYVPAYPITQLDTYEYTYNGATQVAMSHDEQTYDSYGNLLTDANTDSINSQTITKTIVYGTWNGSACVAITNTAVVDHPCTITTKNGTTQLAYETFTYNSNGAPTASTEWISSTDTLTTNYTANSNGTMATKTLPNGQVITNTYGNCNSLLLTDSTTTVNSVAIDNKQTWNCNGAVVTDTTDPNSNEDDYAYDSMNRISSYTDRLENVTSYAYGTPTLDHVKITDPLSVVSYVYNDGLGRTTNRQVCQTTGCSNLDTSSKSYAWNGTNFETKTYVPCVQTVLNTACTTVALTADVNPIAGPTLSTDANSGTLTYAVNSKDFSVTAGPAPSQENTKVLQTEVDGFGRITSTCALTSSGYNGRVSCGQTMGNSGTLTSNTYSFDATTGAPKVVTTRGSQTHTTITDSIGRPTSIATPEAGTVTYLYDSDQTSDDCGNRSSAGALLKVTKASGTYNCIDVDGVQRVTDTAHNAANSICKRFRFDSTANAYWTTPTGYPSSPYIVGRLMEASTDDCSGTKGNKLTDEWFAYDKVGRMTDLFEWTPNSGGYYHTTIGYDADGTPTSFSGLPSGYSSITWGVDGEDRPNSMSYGSTTVVSATAGNGFKYDAASRPTNVPVGSSGDQDTYTYDSVGNMTGYTFSVNSTSDAGVLTWNSIGSLQKLAITDGFNSGGTQTCTYGTSTVEGYDDVGRLLDANCGSSIQHDSWTYDQYDNANRTGNPGTSWNSSYSSSNNQFTLTGATYDSDGDLTYDGVNTYSWNGYGQMAGTISGNHTVSCGSTGSYCATYDAFGRVVEFSNGTGTTYAQILLSPIGRVAYMNGTGLAATYIPAPGGGDFFMTGGNMYFQHPDWLGTKRLSTNLSTRAYEFDVAYTPYGETYDSFGSLVTPDFTGLKQDIIGGLYSTTNRQLAINASRWLSPDPAHSGWNAYAYPTDPNTQTDPSGLCPFCRMGEMALDLGLTGPCLNSATSGSYCNSSGPYQTQDATNGSVSVEFGDAFPLNAIPLQNIGINRNKPYNSSSIGNWLRSQRYQINEDVPCCNSRDKKAINLSLQLSPVGVMDAPNVVGMGGAELAAYVDTWIDLSSKRAGGGIPFSHLLTKLADMAEKGPYQDQATSALRLWFSRQASVQGAIAQSGLRDVFAEMGEAYQFPNEFVTHSAIDATHRVGLWFGNMESPMVIPAWNSMQMWELILRNLNRF